MAVLGKSVRKGGRRSYPSAREIQNVTLSKSDKQALILALQKAIDSAV